MAVPRNQCATLSVSFTARVDAQLNQKRNNEAGLPGPWPTREQDLTATRWRVESLQGQTGQQPGTCPWGPTGPILAGLMMALITLSAAARSIIGLRVEHTAPIWGYECLPPQ